VDVLATNKMEDRAGALPPGAVDLAIVAEAERALTDGLALKRWWDQSGVAGRDAHRFELIRSYNGSDGSFGFFDRAPLDGRLLPVMGVVDEMLYDQAKRPQGKRFQRELREFVLRYLLRVSDFRQPEVSTRPAPPRARSVLSWCPEPQVRRGGFGFSQHYYKLRSSGAVGKFTSGEEFAIVDLRDLGERYEWIVLKVRIFDFDITFRLPGSSRGRLVLPLEEESFLVLSRDFIVDEERPAPGVAGRYGFGYSFLKRPSGRDAIVYGPGHFDAAFQLIQFSLLDGGETRVHLIFVANRPEKVLNVSVDPVDWSFGLADLMSFGWTSRALAPMKELLGQLPRRLGSFDPLTAYVSLANLLSGGLAAKELCISKQQLEKEFLIQHFRQHYQMLVGSLLTWRKIPDWLDENSLPGWIVTGLSS
jgi:hypothetical protein